LDEVVNTAPGAPKRVNPGGYLIVSKGYFANVQVEPLDKARAPLPPLKTPGKPTDAEKILAADHWTPVIALSGTYAVKGNTLTLNNTTAKTEGPQGYVPVIAEFSLEGNNTLRTTVRAADGKSETRRKYTRVE
jgi:hypothetical protein